METCVIGVKCLLLRKNWVICQKSINVVCKKAFKTKTIFNEHRKYNDEHNSYRLSCEKCNQMWLDEDQLKYHMEMKHNKHVCVKCTSTLEGRENLRAHFREKHPAFVIASQLI